MKKKDHTVTVEKNVLFYWNGQICPSILVVYVPVMNKKYCTFTLRYKKTNIKRKKIEIWFTPSSIIQTQELTSNWNVTNVIVSLYVKRCFNKKLQTAQFSWFVFLQCGGEQNFLNTSWPQLFGIYSACSNSNLTKLINHNCTELSQKIRILW